MITRIAVVEPPLVRVRALEDADLNAWEDDLDALEGLLNARASTPLFDERALLATIDDALTAR